MKKRIHFAATFALLLIATASCGRLEGFATPPDAAAISDGAPEAGLSTAIPSEDASRGDVDGSDGTGDATLPSSGSDTGAGDAGTPDAPLMDADVPEDAEPDADVAHPPDASASFPTLDAGGCVIPSSAWTAPSPTPPPLPPETAPTTDSLINVPITVNDIIYDPYTQLIYASVPSSFGANGNSIARIDPTSGAIVGTVYVGSEPGALAESADGQYLYVGLNGSAAIERYVLSTQTPDLQFPLVSSADPVDPNEALYIQVLPTSPHSILVASGPTVYFGSAVAVYDDGVPRATVLENQRSNAVVATGSDLLALEPYNEGFNALNVLCLNPSGVYLASSVIPELGAEDWYSTYAYADGLMFFPSGEVVDPVNGSVAGAYGTEGPFVFEASVSRLYFLDTVTVNDAPVAAITAYDQTHFTPAGQATFPGVAENRLIRLVRWGRYGFAFVTLYGELEAGEISIVRSAVVPVQP